MRRARSLFTLLLALGACRGEAAAQVGSASQQEIRTALRFAEDDRSPPPEPPEHLFSRVQFPSPVGPLWAYVSRVPTGGARRPAIIWLHGGFSNGIGPMWAPGRPENDQSAFGFHEAGLVVMHPSLRGGNDNPGHNERFVGEVNDVIAAAEYLATLDTVDPRRIYLAGHSTGGTLALLVAARTQRFRAVFSFGPIADVRNYGAEYFPESADEREVRLRSPIRHLAAIRTPTWVIEGEDGNANQLPPMRAAVGRAPVRFCVVERANHFQLLQPVTSLIARKILRDDAPRSALTLSTEDIRVSRTSYGPWVRVSSNVPAGTATVSLTHVEVFSPREVVTDNLEVAAFNQWLDRAESLARERVTPSTAPWGVRVRVTLRPGTPPVLGVSGAAGDPPRSVSDLLEALERLPTPQPTHDPVRLLIQLEGGPLRGGISGAIR